MRVRFFLILIPVIFLLACVGGTETGNPELVDRDKKEEVITLSVSYPAQNSQQTEGVSRIKSLLTDNATKSNLKDSDLKKVTQAEVFLYSLEDEDFKNPLTKKISPDENGNYIFFQEDFFQKENLPNIFMARSFFVSPLSGKKIMLKAIVDRTTPDINPLAYTLSEKISRVFGSMGINLSATHWEILKEIISEITREIKNEGISFDFSGEEEVKVTAANEIIDPQSSETISENLNTASEGLFTRLAEEIVSKKDEIRQKSGQEVRSEKIHEQMIRFLLSLGYVVENSDHSGIYAFLPLPPNKIFARIPGEPAFEKGFKQYRLIKPEDIIDITPRSFAEYNRLLFHLKEQIEKTTIIPYGFIERLIENPREVTLNRLGEGMASHFVWSNKEEVTSEELTSDIRGKFPKNQGAIAAEISKREYYSPQEKEKIRMILLSGLSPDRYGTTITGETKLTAKEVFLFIYLIKNRSYLINREKGWVRVNIKYLAPKNNSGIISVLGELLETKVPEEEGYDIFLKDINAALEKIDSPPES